MTIKVGATGVHGPQVEYEDEVELELGETGETGVDELLEYELELELE